MEEECVIVDETSGTTPPQKKMKQSRLPFTPLQGKSPQAVSKKLKRKLSDADLDCKSPKTPRSDSESTKNKNQAETELSDTKDTKEEKNTTKDVEEMVTNDVHEKKTEKKEEVKENLMKRGRRSVSKIKTPAKSTPSKKTEEEKKNTEKSNEDLIEDQEQKVKKRGRSTGSVSKIKTPAKSTPSKKTEEEKKNTEKSNEDLIEDQEQKVKKRGRSTGSGKTPGKATHPEAKKAEQHESGKQEDKLKKKKTPSKGKDDSSKKEKTPGKLDKFTKKDPGEEIVNEDKVGSKLQQLPDVSDDDSAEINESNSESDLMEEKSNIQKLDGKILISKDGSKKGKATDTMPKSIATNKTAAGESQIEPKMESEKDKAVKKVSRNSLDAFVKKGAEAIAMKENGAKTKNKILNEKTTNGDIEEESESIKSPTATNKSLSSNDSKSPESGNCNDSESETMKTPDSSFKSPQAVKPIKLTPGQLAKEAERLKKKEEREKEREEKLKKKQQEIEDKKKLKEDEKKLKEEERKKKEDEREKEKKQKEEERQQKIEEKEQQKKELEKEKEEKKRIKQEAIDAKLKEKQKKDDEKKLQEDEERRQKEQAKAKFSNFFVAKKVILTSVPEEKKNEYFCQFQLKKDMRLAPVIRHQLANQSKESLDEYISGNRKESEENLFIKSIKFTGYTRGTSARTFPPQEQKEEENDCEVIEEEDDGIGEAVVTSESVPKGKTTVRRKVLKFCENNRPPYRGTWRKKTQHISARRPFRKDEDVFNYEYDSDDDWEEEANGESLSDCEDEKDEDEDGKTGAENENDYEVDNDFFVPHGYLSDDEGKSDQEEEENEMEVDDEKDTKKKKEQLKQKQTDFENEIKQKTRQLKPRVFGCLWLSEEDTNKAFDQLLKVLNPHRAVVCCSSKLPIATSYSKVKPKDMSKETNDSAQDGDDAAGALQGGYAKNFPEEGVPALIKLLHCNRNSKVFLGKEFCEYWKKNSEEGLEDSMASRHGLLAKAKIDTKISELGAIWGKNHEEGAKTKYMMWYLPLEVREKYGLSELSSMNTWTYILKPKERNTQDCTEEPSVDPKTPRNNKESKTPKITNKDSKTPKITAFAKKCSPGSSNNFSKPPSGIPAPGSTNGATPKTPQTPLETSSAKTPRTPLEGSSAKTPRTPSEASATGSQKKLFSKAPQEQSAANTPSKTPKSSIANFFKKKVDKESPKDGEDKVKQGEQNEKLEESGKLDDIITLE